MRQNQDPGQPTYSPANENSRRNQSVKYRPSGHWPPCSLPPWPVTFPSRASPSAPSTMARSLQDPRAHPTSRERMESASHPKPRPLLPATTPHPESLPLPPRTSAEVGDLAERYRDEARVQEAAEITTRFFSKKTALGVLPMREHRLFHNNIDVDELIKYLGSSSNKRSSRVIRKERCDIELQIRPRPRRDARARLEHRACPVADVTRISKHHQDSVDEVQTGLNVVSRRQEGATISGTGLAISSLLAHFNNC